MARVLILVENLSVPFDRRVWQEAQALRQAGHEVQVVCPRGERYDREPSAEIESIRIHRYPLIAAQRGAIAYIREYVTALWRSMKLAWRTRPHDIVHICNPPDLLFLVALPFKLRGAKVVFDQHDLVPELYLSRFGRGRDLIHRALMVCERLTYRFADVVLATNESYAEVARTRGRVRPDRVFVVRSAPKIERFRAVDPDPELKRGRPHLLHFHGVMGPQDGVDFALRSLAELRRRRDDWTAIFAGDGDVRPQMMEFVHELELQDHVSFPGRISDKELLSSLATADVGLSPDPSNPLNDVSTMNKIMEYMALGLPVVSFELPEARASAGEAAVYAPANDVAAMAELISDLLDHPEERDRRGGIGLERVRDPLAWERSVESLLEAYATLR